MANDSESIGGIGIDLGLNMGGLQADFDAAVSLAVSKGATLAEAINQALKLPDTTPLSDALAQIGAATDATAGKLDAMAGQLNSVAAAAQNYAGSAEAILQAQKDANEELANAQQALATIQGLFDQGSASANDLARAAEAVQSAFSAANPAMDQFKSATEGIATDSQTAATGFSEMATQLAAIGTALAFTEGLKTLGEDALAAADNLTRATTALTVLTGDAGQARAEISQLNTLGMSDGLSLPSLYTAATRLTALLPEGADVVSLLGHVADASQTMGTSFDSASQRFANMIANGTVMARSLGSLGITMTDLATAINDLNPSLDASATNAAKLFKALDPGDRLTVVTDMLGKFDGMAQKIASETWGGQIQIVANQFELIGQQLGQVLLPALTSFTGFLQSDILPDLKAMVDGFSGLPEPVKNFGVGLAIAAAAIVPLLGAVAAVTLAIQGLSILSTATGSVISTLSAFFTTEAVEAGAAAAAVGTLASADTAAGTAGNVAAEGATAAAAAFTTEAAAAREAAAASMAAETGVGAGAIGAGATAGVAVETGVATAAEVGEMGLLAAAAVDVGIAMAALAIPLAAAGAALDAMYPATQDLSKGFNDVDAFIASDTPKITDLGQAMEQLKAKTSEVGPVVTNADDSVQHLDTTIESTGPVVDQVNALLREMGLNFDQVSTSATSAGIGISSYQGALDKFYKTQDDLNSKLNDAAYVLETVKENADGSKQSIIDIAAAEAAFQRALDASNGTLATHLTTIAQLPEGFTRYKAALDSVTPDIQLMIDDEKAAVAQHNATIAAFSAAGFTSMAQGWRDLAADAQFGMNAVIQDIHFMNDAELTLVDPLHTARDAAKDAQAAFVSLFDVNPAPMDAIAKAMYDFGNKVDSTRLGLRGMLADLPAVFAGFDAGRTTIGQVDDDLGKTSAAITKLAKEDLPTAIAAWQTLIDKVSNSDLPNKIQLIDQYTTQMMQDQIKWGEEAGQSVGNIIIALENLRLKQEALKTLADGLAPTYLNMGKDVASSIDQIGNAFSAAIVQGKDFGDAMVTILENLATKLLSDAVLGAVKQGFAAMFAPSTAQAASQAAVASSAITATAALTGEAEAMNAEADAAGTSAGANTAQAASNTAVTAGAAGGTGTAAAGGTGAGGAAAGLTGLSSAISGIAAAVGPAVIAVGAFITVFTAVSDLFEQKASAMSQASFWANAGVTPQGLTNLSNLLGVNFDTGPILAELRTMDGVLVNGQASAAQIASAAASVQGQINSLTAQNNTLLQQMDAALAVGNTALADKIYSAIQSNNTQIQSLGSVLTLIDSSSSSTSTAAVTTAASTQQMVQALTNANVTLANLQGQQSGLQNAIIQAEASGNTALVTSLTTQLGTVNTSISTQTGLLGTLNTSVTALAPDIAAAVSTAQAGESLFLAGGGTGPVSLQQLSDDIRALQSALQSGDIAAIDQSTATLSADILQQTQSPAVVAAIKEMQDALASGNADAIKTAADDLKSAENNNADKLAAAEKQMSDAIVSGNAAAIAAANTALESALATQSTAATAAVVNPITGMFGVMHADSATIAQAIANEQATVNGLTTQLANLQTQLYAAIASGNGPLVTAIEQQIGTTNTDLNTANSILNQIQVNTGSANDLIAQGITGATSSASNTAQAIANLNTTISGEQGLVADLTIQLTNALSAGNTDLATKIQSAIQTVNGYIQANTTLLNEITGNTGQTATNTGALTGATPTTTPLPVNQTPSAPSPLPVAPVSSAPPAGPGSPTFTPLAGVEADPIFQIPEILHAIDANIAQYGSSNDATLHEETDVLNRQLALLQNPPPGPVTPAITDLQAHIASDIQSMMTAQAAGDSALAQKWADAIGPELDQLKTLTGGVDQANLNLVNVVDASITAADAAKDTPTKIQALMDEQNALTQLSINAQNAGNATLASSYAERADMIVNQIATLGGYTQLNTGELIEVATHFADMAAAEKDIPAKIADLKTEMGADQELANQALAAGNTDLATAYDNAAEKIKNEIQVLDGPLNTIANDMGNLPAAFASATRGNFADSGNAPPPATGRIPHYQTGGIVPAAGIAHLDAGELVVPPQDVGPLLSPGPLPSGISPADVSVISSVGALPPDIAAMVAYAQQQAILQGKQTPTGGVPGTYATAPPSTTGSSTLPDIAAGFKATADQITNAINDEKGVLAALQGHQADLLQALAAAIATGDTVSAAGIKTELSTVGSDISNANATLSQLQGLSTAGNANTAAIPAGFKASADQITAALTNEQGIIAGLKSQQSDLNQALIAAIAAGDTGLTASLQTQLSTVNSSLNTATSTLTQLQTITQTGNTSTAIALTGIKASADQMAAAMANAQKTVDTLTTQLNDLNQQLIAAEADNNTTLVGTLQGEIGTTNSQLTTANGLLGQITTISGLGNASASTIADNTALTASSIKEATANEQAVIDGLTSKLGMYNNELINALAAGNMTLATTIQNEINTTNSELSSANNTLKQIQTIGGAGGGAAGGGTGAGSGSVANPYSSGGYGYVPPTAPPGGYDPNLLLPGALVPPTNLDLTKQTWIQGIGVIPIDPNAAANHTAAISALQNLIPGYLSGGLSGPSGSAGPHPTTPIPSYDVGGFVPFDMAASLHANEWVIPPPPHTVTLPPDVLARISMPVQIPGAPVYGGGAFTGGSSSVTINAPIAVYGASNPRQTAHDIMDYLRTASGKFVSTR